MTRKYGVDLRGEFHTVEELQEIRLKYARIANKRLRALEKADMTVYAYDVATLYTQRTRGTKRFSESRKALENPQSLMREIDQLTTFLNMQTSTVRGQRQLEKQKMRAFEKKLGAEIPDKKEFWNFLSSNVFQQLRHARRGDSNYFVDFYVRAKEKGWNNQKIYDALEQYRKGEIQGIDELFDEAKLSFIKGNKRANNKRKSRNRRSKDS